MIEEEQTYICEDCEKEMIHQTRFTDGEWGRPVRQYKVVYCKFCDYEMEI